MAASNPFAQLFQPSQPAITTKLAMLSPGEKDAPISLKLIDAELGQTSYECISYDRSKDSDTTSIEVDGSQAEVPKLLADALRAFRRRERPRTLWADLLISQDAQERSMQVDTLRTLLSNADRTLVWLMDENDQTQRAFEVFHTLANRWKQACLHANAPPNILRATAEQLLQTRDKFLSYSVSELKPNDLALWRVIKNILSSSYFTSVQSIPDIVLAKKALLICGRSNIGWLDFVEACRGAVVALPNQIYPGLPIFPEIERNFALIMSLDIADRRRRQGESLELLPMIQSARDCESKDTREFVYAMLPLVTPSKRLEYHSDRKAELPQIDYTKSVQDVLKAAARYIVHERQDLMIWWSELPPCARHVQTGLPSWVTDFGAKQPSQTHKVLPKGGLRAWWEYVRDRKLITISNEDVLGVQAHPLDRIVHVSPVLTPGNCRRWCLKEWQQLPPPSGFLESFEGRNEKFWRTIVMNYSGSGEGGFADYKKPDAAFGSNFQSMLAEERILQLLDCTPDQLMQPEMQQRMATDPQILALLPAAGAGQPFQDLLEYSSLGRRFFRTESGRFGMTAVEQPSAAMKGIEASSAQAREQQRPTQAGMPDFSAGLNDPMVSHMLRGFQQFVNQRDPQAGRVLAQAMRGEMPGREAPKLGVREGDILVALVGGFQPYVLRPKADDSVSEGGRTLRQDSAYEYVGDCYLHGVMDGEPFQVRDTNGAIQYKVDVPLIDISIV